MNLTCPKCGAAFKYIASGTATFRCGSAQWPDATGDRFSQTNACLIRELTAENERLRKELDDWKLAAMVEADAGDEARSLYDEVKRNDPNRL